MIDAVHQRESRVRSFTKAIGMLDEVLALRTYDALGASSRASSAASGPLEPSSFAVVAR